jgi:hypothetical protein
MDMVRANFRACRLHKAVQKGDYRAMNPPTEQLIRDYLNRVSVAARGRLDAEDRRALVSRTREFIEQNSRALGPADSTAALKLLAGLGDPAALVDRECSRLAADGQGQGGGESPGASRGARAWRRRPARRSLTGLMASAAEVVPPGQAEVPVPEPAEEVPLTGELSSQTRPISARWKPGAPMMPKQPRAQRAGIPRRLHPGDWRPGGRREGLPADQQADAPALEGQAVPPPLPADVRPEQRRPAWPLAGTSRPEPTGPTGRTGSGGSAGSARPGGQGGSVGGAATLNGHAEAGSPPPGVPADMAGDADRREPEGPGGPHSLNDRVTEAEPGETGPDPSRQGGSRANGTASGGIEPNETGPDGTWPGGSRLGGTEPGGSKLGGTDLGGSGLGRPRLTGTELNGNRPGGPPLGDNTARSDTGGSDAHPYDAARSDTGGSDAHPNDTARSDTDPSGERPDLSGASGARPGRGARVVWATGVRRAGGARRGGARRAGMPRTGGADSGSSASAGGGRAGGGRAGGGDDARGAGPGGGLADARAGAWRLARVVAARARRHPLEATAVVLLGLGGAIYPPVWLMGAAVALVSRVWDFRDKWIGLAVPVFLVIVGMVADVSLGGPRHELTAYVREAWTFGGHFSRIAALLGAVYLTWRAERGRRPPAVPPWNKPHRIG